MQLGQGIIFLRPKKYYSQAGNESRAGSRRVTCWEQKGHEVRADEAREVSSWPSKRNIVGSETAYLDERNGLSLITKRHVADSGLCGNVATLPTLHKHYHSIFVEV